MRVSYLHVCQSSRCDMRLFDGMFIRHVTKRKAAEIHEEWGELHKQELCHAGHDVARMPSAPLCSISWSSSEDTQ